MKQHSWLTLNKVIQQNINKAPLIKTSSNNSNKSNNNSNNNSNIIIINNDNNEHSKTLSINLLDELFYLVKEGNKIKLLKFINDNPLLDVNITSSNYIIIIYLFIYLNRKKMACINGRLFIYLFIYFKKLFKIYFNRIIL